MTRSRWALRAGVAMASSLALAAGLPAGFATAASDGTTGGRTYTAQSDSRQIRPAIKLVAAQNYIQIPQLGKTKYVILDPSVYIEVFRAPLQFDVQRASYAKPITITEVIKPPGRPTVRRWLPAWTIQGWYGLNNFIHMTIQNTKGKIVSRENVVWCPNGFPQRADPGSPPTSPYPTSCASDPFQKSMVWGLQRGWGTDPIGGGFAFGGQLIKLTLGKYKVTVTIPDRWRSLMHVSARNASAKVIVQVIKGTSCGGPICPATHRHPIGHPLPKLPSVPLMNHPPASARPDLSPLPSWGISVFNIRATKKHPANSQLQFGATVWIGGNGPLDVEGFRNNGSPTMPAYQYFWQNGRIIGRARAGTMGFDNKKGHNHWHFQQFAQYRLLSKNKSLVLRSQKVGFCIAATDPVNLLMPRATWVPSFTGFTGACGSRSALWVQEVLPVGWGDTYFQSGAGQSFDITNLANGTYYIEIIANPGHVLRETNYGNDVSLRKVILGGTPGHRTVTVPAYQGIDYEHS